MAEPTVTVRVAFDTDPMAAVPSWTDISGDVLSFYTKRGRQHELGRIETGIAIVELLNTSGNYWPLNAGGAYFGKVLPGKKFNIRATYPLVSGSLRPNAVGDEENLQISPNGGESNWEDVDDVIPDEMATYCYNGGAAYIRDLHNIGELLGTGTITKITVYARAKGNVLVTQPSLKIAIKSGTGDAAPDTITEDEKTVTTSWVNYSKEWATNPATAAAWTPDEIKNLQIGCALRDCRVGFFMVTECTQIWVDVDYVPGYDIYTGFIESWKPKWLDQTVALTTVRCADIGKRFSRHDMNNAGEAEELSGVRVGNVLDEIGWPAADRDLDTGQTTIKATGAQVAVNAMTHLFKVQDSEVGIIFLAPDGEVQFQDRHARFKAPYLVSLAIFGDDAPEEKYRFIEPSYDDQFIFNDIRRTRDGGTEQSSQDATSQDDYGKSTSNKTALLMLTDGEAKDQCDYMLSQYKDPNFRISALEIYPESDPDNLFPLVLGLDISSRITLRLNEASLDQDYHIEGIIHRFDRRRGPWTTRWQLSDATGVLYWALGITGFSEIGETTRLCY